MRNFLNRLRETWHANTQQPHRDSSSGLPPVPAYETWDAQPPLGLQPRRRNPQPTQRAPDPIETYGQPSPARNTANSGLSWHSSRRAPPPQATTSPIEIFRPLAAPELSAHALPVSRPPSRSRFAGGTSLVVDREGRVIQTPLERRWTTSRALAPKGPPHDRDKSKRLFMKAGTLAFEKMELQNELERDNPSGERQLEILIKLQPSHEQFRPGTMDYQHAYEELMHRYNGTVHPQRPAGPDTFLEGKPFPTERAELLDEILRYVRTWQMQKVDKEGNVTATPSQPRD
jgi:hypothetical protein